MKVEQIVHEYWKGHPAPAESKLSMFKLFVVLVEVIFVAGTFGIAFILIVFQFIKIKGP